VRLFRQAMRVLGIALAYGFNRRSYLASDFADHASSGYSSTTVFNQAASESASR
jgi:hypothetical protein